MIKNYKKVYERLPQKARRLNEYLDDYLAIRLGNALENYEVREFHGEDSFARRFESLFQYAEGEDLKRINEGSRFLRNNEYVKAPKYVALYEKGTTGSQEYFHLELFIACMIHDSMAGFIKDINVIEPTGYLHPRKVFAGDE